MEKNLAYFYSNLDQPTAFSGVKRISKAANTSIKKTRKWLSNQRSYSLHKASRKPKTFRKYKTPLLFLSISNGSITDAALSKL